ncbi:MAG: hypothetical protein HOU01_18280 [Streptomycetaceae bacterium]|nr:hypothetical protein [Streptomycetaceae bacterium]
MSTPAVEIHAVSYSYETAAAATGLSISLLKQAVRTGDLVPRYVRVDGRLVAKPVFEHGELHRFIAAGATERERDRDT